MIARGDKIVPVPAIFGFPGFQDGKLLINARGETAAEKKTFSDSLKEQRVILPATGFYEWSSDKTKYLFSVGSSSVLYLCGLYKIIDGKYRFALLDIIARDNSLKKLIFCSEGNDELRQMLLSLCRQLQRNELCIELGKLYADYMDRQYHYVLT